MPNAGKDPWEAEIYYDLSTPLEVGKEYVISMKAKATSGVSYNFWPGVIDGDTQYLPSFSAGENGKRPQLRLQQVYLSIACAFVSVHSKENSVLMM